MAIWLIARNELRQNIREGRFLLTGLIIVLLALVSLWTSTTYYQTIQKQHRQANHADRRNWESQADKNPHSAAHYGMYAFKPKSALSLFDQGVDKHTGVALYLEAHRRSAAQYSPIQEQSSLAQFGDLTPAFVLIYLLPFLIILIGFNAISKERESDNLRLLLGQGISYRQLLVGKWLGVLLPTGLVVIPLLLFTLVLLWSVQDFGGFSLAGFGMITIALLFYYAAIAAFTVWISNLYRQSAYSFVTLLSLWIVVGLVVPKVASTLAENWYVLPNSDSISLKIEAAYARRKIGNIHDLKGEAYEELVNQMLKKYGVSDVSQLPVNMAGVRLAEGEKMDTKMYGEQFQHIHKQLNAQGNVFRAAMLLSPIINMRFISMGFAGTDESYHWRFSEAADRYRYDFVQYLNNYIADKSGTQEAYTTFVANETVWKDAPVFEYQSPIFGEIAQMQGLNLLILLGWTILATTLLWTAGRKKEIL